MSQFIALAGMLITMLVAFGLDRWLKTLQRQAVPDVPAILWLNVLANLVMAASWLLLVWWGNVKCRQCRLAAFVYILVGTLLAGFVPLQMTVPESLHPILLFSQTRYLRAAWMDLGFPSRFALSAALIIVLGLFLLLPSKPDRQVT